MLNNLCTGETREGGATLGWCHQGGRLERKLWVVMDLMMFRDIVLITAFMSIFRL